LASFGRQLYRIQKDLIPFFELEAEESCRRIQSGMNEDCWLSVDCSWSRWRAAASVRAEATRRNIGMVAVAELWEAGQPNHCSVGKTWS
jgi:hypothetical protein